MSIYIVKNRIWKVVRAPKIYSRDSDERHHVFRGDTSIDDEDDKEWVSSRDGNRQRQMLLSGTKKDDQRIQGAVTCR